VNDTHDWTRLWASGSDDDRLETRDALKGHMAIGRGSEAERILAMDPDIIIMRVGSYNDFMHDPRWQGMKVVQTKRVYENAGALTGYTFDVDNGPLGLRWLAEVIHPECLQPRVRELIREHYMKVYGYSLGDDAIDKMLDISGNKNALGYARFTRNMPASSRLEMPR
jgi:iron complex transport system substrate-binding protein